MQAHSSPAGPQPPAQKPQRQSALRQTELMKQLTSGGGGLSGGLSVPVAQESPPSPSVSARPHVGVQGGGVQKRAMQPAPLVVRKRKAHLLPPLDVKEYIENDGEVGVAQRVGEGPARPMTPHVLFLRDCRSQMLQPEKREAWTPDEVAHGIALVYQHLPAEKKLKYETDADQATAAYKEAFRRFQKTLDTREKAAPAYAFEVYAANNRTKLAMQHPASSQQELGAMLEANWEAEQHQVKQAYVLLADREKILVQKHRSLWYKDPAYDAAVQQAHANREYVDIVPQYCATCGSLLLRTRDRTCQCCGTIFDRCIIAFAVGGGAPMSARPVASTVCDESQHVDLETV